jgi:hypothetical protein
MAKDNGAKTAVVAVLNISFGEEVADTWEKNIMEQVWS